MRRLNRPFTFASVSKRVYVQNLLYQNEFDLHEKGYVGKTLFHLNGLARRLVFTQRQKATWKWPIPIALILSDLG